MERDYVHPRDGCGWTILLCTRMVFFCTHRCRRRNKRVGNAKPSILERGSSSGSINESPKQKPGSGLVCPKASERKYALETMSLYASKFSKPTYKKKYQ